MKIVINQSRNCMISLCLMVPILVLIACNPTETEPFSPCWSYYDPVDSVYKLFENFEFSYTSQDIWHYMQCFRIDFEFYYESNGDTLSWGYDTEQDIHYSLFNQVCKMDLTLSGSEEYPWSGDTTGSTLVLPREYDLKVYMVPDSAEHWALGTAQFICRQDSMEEWYVWQWWDFPDPGKDGWGNIKVLFTTSPSTH